MKTLPVLCMSIFSVSAVAQNYQTTVTKDQFLEMYENVISMNENSGESGSMAREMMREHMSEEQFQSYLKQEKVMEQARIEMVANCVGVSADKLVDIKAKATPTRTLSMFKQCANSLPDSFTLGEEGIGANPQLADFSACVDRKTEKEFGLKASKLEQCQAKVDLEEGDW